MSSTQPAPATATAAPASPQSPKLSARLLEKVPLVGDPDDRDDLITAYGSKDYATWVKPNPKYGSTTLNLTDYEPMKFSSFKVCCMRRGTIMESPVLLVEQLILIGIFLACCAPVYVFFKDDVGHGGGGKMSELSVRRFIANQETKMRAFSLIMTGLAAFLLSFYTSIIVTRWWSMRTGGVGGIKAATVDLELLLYQAVEWSSSGPDRQILEAARRYGQTSLFLIFMWRRGQIGKPKEDETLKQMLIARGLLTKDECEQLVKWNKHCLHETIWAWQMAIVNKLHFEQKIKSDQLYALLLQKCLDGRQAVQLAHTHLAVRVPMQYVHLLGLLVKMHNFVLAVIMGLLFGAALRDRQYILAIQLFCRVFILPFLFNAILLINCDLADPFDGSEADFPGDVYQENIGKDCVGMMGATDNTPEWLRLDHTKNGYSTNGVINWTVTETA